MNANRASGIIPHIRSIERAQRSTNRHQSHSLLVG
jgi:hypothetical protein